MSADELEAYKKAYRELELGERRLGFYVHLAAYVAVNTGLIVGNLLFTPGFLWFFFPLLAWGAGLGVHLFSVTRSSAKALERREREAERRMAGEIATSPRP